MKLSSTSVNREGRRPPGTWGLVLLEVVGRPEIPAGSVIGEGPQDSLDQLLGSPELGSNPSPT